MTWNRKIFTGSGAFQKVIFAAAALVASTLAAAAQTSPNWTYGFVPTQAQWNAQWASKQDYLGAPPLLRTGGTMSGPLVTTASLTSNAGFNVAPGVAPTTPNNGDIWTTALGLYAQINGVTIGPLSGATSSSFGKTSPITLSFPSGIVTYGFDFTVANTFLAQQTDQGATTTQPGWYVQLAGDTNARVRVGLNSTDVASISFGPGNAIRDAFVERLGAGSLRFGTVDAAAPVAQTLSVQNVLAGTSNAAGANLTIAGSRGTGTGAGGGILFQTAPLGSSGSAQNALATALTIFPSGGLATGAAADQGAGALNLAGSLYSNGTGPTGTGGYVRGTGPTIAGPTITGTIAGSPAITSPTINSGAISGTFTGAATFSGALTLGSALTYGGVTLANSVSGTGPMVLGTSPTISGGTFSGAQTFSGAPSFTGLVSGTCANGVAINSLGLAITVACPGAASSIQPGSTGVVGGVVGDVLAVGAGPTLVQFSPTAVTNSLVGDVALSSSSSTYVDGPSVAQGVVGNWVAEGQVLITDTSATAAIPFCKLWDGTTTMASNGGNATAGTGTRVEVSLSGSISSPAGNIRISCSNQQGTSTSAMRANNTGLGKDSTVTAHRTN